MLAVNLRYHDGIYSKSDGVQDLAFESGEVILGHCCLSKVVVYRAGKEGSNKPFSPCESGDDIS